MKNSRLMVMLNPVLLVLLIGFAHVAQATTINLDINFDLDDYATFDPSFYDSGNIAITPQSLVKDDVLNVAINFVDKETGAHQDMTLFDSPAGSPVDVVNASVIGSLPDDLVTVKASNFDIYQIQMAGEPLVLVADRSNVTCATASGEIVCQTGSDDLNGPIGDPVMFHGVKISMTLGDLLTAAGGQFPDPIDFSSVRFNFQADQLVQGVWPVPLPAAVWLFGSGLLGLVGIARRNKAA